VHELSIADAVVAIAAAHAGERRVTKVEVRVGHLRQVVPSALALAFELVAEGTVVEGAELAIEPVPAAVACRNCGSESEVSGFPLACLACGSLDVGVVRGDELLVEALELDDGMETETAAAGKGDAAYVG
jgi:hydrogenase nickel incorporation protein HypA/HybF